MTFRIAGGVLASVVICVVGCGSNATRPFEGVGHSVNAIQGGVVDTTHSFALGICGGAEGGPEGGQNCQLLCSGALIAPNLVITARHCVDNVSSDTVDCTADTFGSPLYPASEYFVTPDNQVFDLGAKWYPVTQIITPTPTAFCGNDLAILILGSCVPKSEVPVLAVPEIWYPIDSPMYSTKETAIGYGLDSPSDEDSAGVRRILQNIPIECVPDDTTPALQCPPVDESGVATNEFEAGNGPCEGDSGSSAYEQNNFNAGTFLSLGVLSRGGSSGNMCVGSVYTQLYPWQSLLLSAAKQAASVGCEEPAWTVKPGTVPEGGAPPGDSGTPDGSKLLPIGAACTSSGACESDKCVSPNADAGYTCSESCGDGGGTCPAGFTCFMDFCFGPDGGVGTEDSSGSSGGGGCSCELAKRRGAGGQTSSAGRVLALGLGLFVVRRRRPRVQKE